MQHGQHTKSSFSSRRAVVSTPATTKEAQTRESPSIEKLTLPRPRTTIHFPNSEALLAKILRLRACKACLVANAYATPESFDERPFKGEWTQIRNPINMYLSKHRNHHLVHKAP